MDLAGSTVGIASLGIQVCGSLIAYHERYRDYSNDLAVTYKAITQLKAILVILKILLDNVDEDKRKHAVEAMQACKEDIGKL